MKQKQFISILALVVVILCFGYLGLVTFYPPAVTDNLSEIKIAIISFLTIVLNYYFGSSHSSAVKSDMIQGMIDNNNGNGTPVIKDSTIDKVTQVTNDKNETI